MKQLILVLGLFLSMLSAQAQTTASATANDAALRQQVTQFLDEWHDDAAHANPRYFDKIALHGVYIGTDKSERWEREAFRAWAKPYFDAKKAWEFHAIKRNIAFSDDKSIIWFDEQLNTQMGICQAAGVISVSPTGLQIQHYQLSLTVPNDLLDSIQKQISEFDAKHPVK